MIDDSGCRRYYVPIRGEFFVIAMLVSHSDYRIVNSIALMSNILKQMQQSTYLKVSPALLLSHGVVPRQRRLTTAWERRRLHFVFICGSVSISISANEYVH